MYRVLFGFLLVVATLLHGGGAAYAEGAAQLAQPVGSIPPTIVSFGVDLPSITVEAAETGVTEATLSWYTVGVSQGHELVLALYDIGGWTPLLEEADDPLPAVGERTVTVQHPASFAPPTYRLAIVDGEGRVLDERTVTIPYETSTDVPVIESFITSVEVIDAYLFLQGIVEFPVSWQVTNRQPTTNLVFEQIRADGRVTSVELPRASLWVPSQGEGMVAPAAPEVGEPILLRLSVVDLVEGETLATRELSVEVDTTTTPAIRSFEADASTVDATALARGTARVAVRWEVANRLPESNLVFEQVMPDGRAVSVELPRAEVMVPSMGEGVVAPVMPPAGAASWIQLRLRVVDVNSGVTYDVRDLMLGVVGSVVPLPTQTGAPPATLQPTAPPVAFTVTPDTIDRGGTVTLEWEARGASSVIIYRLLPTGQFGPVLGERLPIRGSLTVSVPTLYVDRVSFYLAALDANDHQLYSTMASARVGCPYTYFFGTPEHEVCPVGEATQVAGAFQSFQGGYMFWRGDTGEIYVLLAGGFPSLQRYQDTWAEGETFDVGESPPAGLYQPVRGFGKVWATQPGVRNQLGWATAEERGYTMTVQRSGAYKYARTYFSTYPAAPFNGRVVYIVENTWGYADE